MPSISVALTPIKPGSEFCEFMIAQTLLEGNSVAVVRNEQLLPIRWQSVQINTHSSEAINLTYDWQYGYGNQLLKGTASEAEVIHLKDRTDDGFIGKPRMKRASPVLTYCATLQTASQALWDNGVFPSGAIALQGKATSDQKDKLRQQLSDQFGGSENRSKMLILDQGSEFQQMFTNPKDAEHNQQLKFAVVEICRVFGVPPTVIGDLENASYSNAAQEARQFARLTLTSWVRKFEAAFAKTLLDDNETIELDMSDYMRGDPTERWNSYKIALEAGVLKPEEVRAMEGY